ncbi:MAG TPA: type II secretion system protein GspN [Polyangiaceae bacterium]|nr:type II secretion system protein GspN [Polyangiaceae bacterium]
MNLSAKAKRILKWAGYAGFYLFCLAFFAYLTFPYDRLRSRIQNEFNRGQTGPNPLTLRLGHLGPYWFSGVRAEDIELISPPKPAEPGSADDAAKPAKPKVMQIDSAHARVSLLRLLVGTVHVNFGASAFGGELSGFTSDADGGRKFELDLDDIGLANAPMIADSLGLPVAGTLTGHVEFLLPESKLAKAEGKLDLKFSGLAVGDGKAKVLNAIALPKVEVGELTLQATAASGNLKIDALSASGKDIDLQAEGSVRLRDPFEQSVLSLSARFKFSDRFMNKDDMTRGLFGSPGAAMPGLFDLVPQNKRAKHADGFYGWRVNGTISHPSFQPAAAGEGAPMARGPHTL